MAEQFPWKVAWITGASGAICGEIARRLAAAGVTVAATARPSDKLDALAAASENIKAFPADVLQPERLKVCVAEDRERARADRPRAVRRRHVCAVRHPQYRPRRVPQDHGAQRRWRDQRRRRGAAVDARAEVGPHRHHGLAVRLCRLAGERQLRREQGGGDQSRRESQARIGGDRRRRHHHQSRLRRYAAQRLLRPEEEALCDEQGALRAEDPREASGEALRDRLPAAGGGLPQDRALLAARRSPSR